MARFTHSVGGETYRFDSLKDVMAKAAPRAPAIPRRVAASNDGERSPRRWPWPTSRSNTSSTRR